MAKGNDKKISIGIDFGTTNTTVSLAVRNGDRIEVECLEFGDPNLPGADYIPTAVLYDSRPNADGSARAPVIGHAAMHPVLDGDIQPGEHVYRLCLHSKFLLGQESMGGEAWAAYLSENPQYATDTDYLRYDSAEFKPSRVVRDFFHGLFSEVLQHHRVQQQKPGGEITLADLRVVVTCPEAWKHGLGQHVGGEGSKKYAIRSQEVLKTILSQMGIGAVEVKSEPEAATVYFAHHLETTHQEQFSGRVMIVDYGGGTLDVCLSRLERKDGGLVITPELGDHHAVDGRFVAGVRFDETLFQLAWDIADAEEILGQSLEDVKKTPEYASFLYKLDHEKRERWVQTSDRLKLAARGEVTEDKDIPCFRVQVERKCRLGATPNLMVQAFEEANKPTLLQCLEGFNHKLGMSPDDRKKLSHHSFRLLMVGGFSRLELARRAVIEHFGWDPDTTVEQVARFPNHADTAYAIAKGAALLACRWARVESVVPFNIGIVSYLANGERGRTPILKAGAKVTDCSDWVFYKNSSGKPTSYRVNGIRQGVEFFISQGQDNADIPINRTLSGEVLDLDSVLPKGCAEVLVAFRFHAEGQEPWVRFQDATNAKSYTEHRLGELIGRARQQPALYEEATA